MNVSERVRHLVNEEARIDMELFQEAQKNKFHPESNPEGAFILNVAENKIVNHLIKEKIEAILSENELPNWVLGYTSMSGNSDVRASVSNFLKNQFGSKSISADNICLSAGAAASLEVLSYVIAQAEDVVVIPAPAYPVYTSDLGIKSKMVRENLTLDMEISGKGGSSPLTVADLEWTYRKLEKEGRNFKVLLLTSPDNPTGLIYSKEQLHTYASWCIEKNIHLVVNEIYGCSLLNVEDDRIKNDYKHNTFPYYSFTRVMEDLNSDYLHWIYALSKDFCMSGMRVGVIHSLNESVMKACGNVNIPHMVSNITQWIIEEIFNDEKFTINFLKENQLALTESYCKMTMFLKSNNIPYVPARGSLFVWADFSKFLKGLSQKDELELWKKIYNTSGVLITPGVGFGHDGYGIFRIVYSAVSLQDLEVAIERMEQLFGEL